MTAGSVLGIEYLYLLNSAYNTLECSSPNLGSWSNEASVPVWCWILIACCVVITLIAIISVGFYCIVDKRRNRSLNCGNK